MNKDCTHTLDTDGCSFCQHHDWCCTVCYSVDLVAFVEHDGLKSWRCCSCGSTDNLADDPPFSVDDEYNFNVLILSQDGGSHVMRAKDAVNLKPHKATQNAHFAALSHLAENGAGEMVSVGEFTLVRLR